MRVFIRLLVLILATGGFPATAQTSDYRIRIRGERISVNHRGKVHPLNLAGKIDAAKITGAEILFAARRAGFIYLVVDVSGQSKLKPDDRQCGAGVEANLIWIKLDRAWKIHDAKSVRYESCWSSVTNDNYRKTNRSMSIEIDNFREDVSLKLAYDAEKPEKGFRITQEALREPE